MCKPTEIFHIKINIQGVQKVSPDFILITIVSLSRFSVLNTAGNNLNSLNDLFEHCCNLTSFLLIILLSLFINSSYCACS